ncbi:MAG: dihydrodipicolinate synthase family protein [candidate division KSB1 bacterium]|nr:dihydrodipicolinate synthase family protein [candidate division KSB1 bacterium]
MNESLKDIIGVINTPFTLENRVDTDSLERYVAHSLKCKVSGFLALGLAAEVNKLGHEEKRLIAETVVNKTDGKVPVICCTTARSQDERLNLSGGWAGTQMIEALDRGVDAFMPTILHDVYGMIYHLHNIGKREKAKILFHKLLPIISFSHQHLDISIHFNKRLVHRQGIFNTAKVREPILSFHTYHENIADELITDAISSSDNINKG